MQHSKTFEDIHLFKLFNDLFIINFIRKSAFLTIEDYDANSIG